MSTVEKQTLPENKETELSLNPVIDRFFRSDNFAGLNYKTQSFYRRDLSDWQQYLEESGRAHTESNWQSNIANYFEHLRQIGRKPKTIERRRAAIRKFATWATDDEIGYINRRRLYEIPHLILSKPSILPIDPEVIENLRQDASSDLRTAVVFELLLNGVRTASIAGIKNADVLDQDDHFQINLRVIRPGSKVKEVEIEGYGADIIREYLNATPFKNPFSPFIKHSERSQRNPKEHLTRQGIWLILRPLLSKANITSPDRLRVSARALGYC